VRLRVEAQGIEEELLIVEGLAIDPIK